jgi:Rhodanese-like domain
MMSLLARLAPLGIVLGLALPVSQEGLAQQVDHIHPAPLALPALPALPVAQDDLSTAPRISMAEFEKLLKSGSVMVIDVRDRVSYSAGHIPGAILIPLGTLETHLPELKAATKPIVAYCS